MSEIENQNKTDENICDCLYDTIIEGYKECFFEEFEMYNNRKFKVNHNLLLQDKVAEYHNDLDILVLFTNEFFEYEKTIYYRIYRHIFSTEGCHENLNPLKDFGIYLYTNGITDTAHSSFILMVDRAIIFEDGCPITMDNIASHIKDYDDEHNTNFYHKIKEDMFATNEKLYYQIFYPIS